MLIRIILITNTNEIIQQFDTEQYLNIWELPPMEYIAKKEDDFFMSLFLYFHRLIKLCLYQKVRTTQITFVINF